MTNQKDDLKKILPEMISVDEVSEMAELFALLTLEQQRALLVFMRSIKPKVMYWD